MSGSAAGSTVGLFTVTKSMNAHGALTVSDPETHATYHVVEYGSEECRDRLATLRAGSTVRLQLRRAGARANVWTAARLLPGTAHADTVTA